MSFEDVLDRRLAGVPGFGRCGSCGYRDTGSPALCSRCANRTLEPLAAPEERCGVCDHPYAAGESSCRNGPCNARWRQFDWNYAIAMRSGTLDRTIKRYKYEDKRAWASIFGRILVGFLDANATTFEPFDLIVAAPTYVGPDGREFDHTREVIRQADVVSAGRWPFDVDEPAAIIKTRATTRLVEAGGYQERKEVAWGPLREALAIPTRSRTAGRRILVYDDVFTDGLSLNETARSLKRAGGAASVSGVTLARSRYVPR